MQRDEVLQKKFVMCLYTAQICWFFFDETGAVAETPAESMATV